MTNTLPTLRAASRAALGLLVLALLAACASVPPVVKVGLVAPFEGRDRAVGYDAIYSARLAVRELNAAGGVNGTRVALVAVDDGGDEQLARQAAASLARDPNVVAVVARTLPASSPDLDNVYANAGLPLIKLGTEPFAPTDPSQLPPTFLDQYAAVTPFDEVAGPYAGPAYDAFGLLWRALGQAEQTSGRIDRSTVQNTLAGLEYEGLTGPVYQPVAP